ncbi:MAG: hypothetical protein ACXVCM_21905, partial [Ktedonobacteraceae bacterium]
KPRPTRFLHAAILLLTAHAMQRRDSFVLQAVLQELDSYGDRGYFVSSVNGRGRNTTVTTTLPSDYCIGFVNGYALCPVINYWSTLCTYVVFCSDRVEF